MQIELVPLLVGLASALGGGVGIKTLIDGLLKIRSGMSAKESSRKVDIVQQRDRAIAREERAWGLVDDEAEKRRQVQEYAARLRRQIIDSGGEPLEEPVLEQTITKAQLRKLRDTEES